MDPQAPATSRSPVPVLVTIGFVLAVIAGYALLQSSGTAAANGGVTDPGAGGPAVLATVDGSVEWTGHGSENNVACDEGEVAAWHWILTPGGANELLDATLTVTYSDGTTESYAPTKETPGAFHWTVNTDGDLTVASASADFTYEDGPGSDNFVLTISDMSCLDGFYEAP